MCGVDLTSECQCEVKWPGFSAALDRISSWASDNLPSQVWVDMDCDESCAVSENEPEGFWEYVDSETEKEWVEPFTENTYVLDYKEIKQAVFGEVSKYF